MSIAPETFVHEWIVRDFYHLQRFLAWEKKCDIEYSKLMGAKAKQ